LSQLTLKSLAVVQKSYNRKPQHLHQVGTFSHQNLDTTKPKSMTQSLGFSIALAPAFFDSAI
jgi:hypothetical protein